MGLWHKSGTHVFAPFDKKPAADGRDRREQVLERGLPRQFVRRPVGKSEGLHDADDAALKRWLARDA